MTVIYALSIRKAVVDGILMHSLYGYQCNVQNKVCTDVHEQLNSDGDIAAYYQNYLYIYIFKNLIRILLTY